jgi:large repetitive protein
MRRAFLIFLFLVVACTMTANAAAISGIVSDSAGSPLKMMAIALKATTPAGTTLARDTTDSTGAYSVNCDSTSGKYVVRTTDAGQKYVSPQYDTVALDGTAKTVNIKMAIVKRASVSGIVTDSATGAAISGVIVRLGNLRRDTTGTDGKYSVDSVTTGATLNFSLTGYVSKTVSPAISDTVLTVNIALAQTAYVTVSGTITDSAAGTALSGAIVRLGNTRRDTTGTDGKYSFDSVTTGAASISASAQGYTAKTASVTVGSAAVTADIALVKVKYGSISGTVTDSAAGTAIAGASVIYGNTKQDSTGADGKYILDSVTAGTGRISVSAQGYGAKTASITVAGDSSYTVNFALVRVQYGSISGTVTDSAAGTAIAGAIVTVTLKNSIASASKIDTTGTDGAYALGSLEFGTYSIAVSAANHSMTNDSVVVSDTANKTVNLKLSALVYFAVSGKVTDSLTGAAVAGALVALRTGSTAVISSTVDSVLTDSSGHYAFDSAFAGARIRVTVTGYSLKRVDLTGATSAAQTIDIPLATAPTAVKSTIGIRAREKVVIAAHRLIVNNFNEPGTIRLMNLKGELVCVQSFPACATFSMELAKTLSAGSYILKISRKNGVLQQRILVR